MKVCPECERQYGEDVEFCAHDGAKLRSIEDENEDPLIGRMLDGRWRIEEKFGEGGMGSIYLASQESVGREVAIKTLRTALSDNEEFADRFMQEAKVTSTISHPHCVTILDFGQTENGTLYLAMEYLDGEPLSDRLDRGKVGLKEALEIAIQVSSALAAAHEHKIVHRDLKPDNIFLLDISDGSTFVKVLDFGISKDIDSEEDMTRTGQIFGTPKYMSPEQCQGEDLDGRSDLYALGCLLYELLAEEPPFSGDKSMSILVSHVQREIPPVREVADREIPNRLNDIVMRLLEKKRHNRPATAADVRQILEDILSNIFVSGCQTNAMHSSGGQQVEGGTTPGMGPSPDRQALEGGNEARSGDLGRADTVTPSTDSELPSPTDGQTGSSSHSGAASGTGQQATAGSPQPAGNQSARRASASRGETADRTAQESLEQEGGRDKGLMALLAAVVLLGFVGVCGGGGYLAYATFGGGDGEQTLLSKWFGSSSGDEASETDASESGAEEATASSEDGDDSKSGDREKAETETQKEESGEDGSAVAMNEAADDDNADEKAESGGGRADETGDDDQTGSPDKTESGNDGSSEDDGSESGGSEATEEEPRESDPDEGQDDDGSERSESSNDSDESAGSDEPKVRPSRFIRISRFSVTGAACDENNVKRKLQAAKGILGRCYYSAAKSNSSLSADVMLDWNISTGGNAIDASVIKSSIGNSTVESCLERSIGAIHFPPPSGGRCYTRVTFDFSM